MANIGAKLRFAVTSLALVASASTAVYSAYSAVSLGHHPRLVLDDSLDPRARWLLSWQAWLTASLLIAVLHVGAVRSLRTGAPKRAFGFALLAVAVSAATVAGFAYCSQFLPITDQNL